jgi:hypothetical protein
MSLAVASVVVLFLTMAILSPFNRRAHAFVGGGLHFLHKVLDAAVDVLDHEVPRGAAWVGAALTALVLVLALLL